MRQAQNTHTHICIDFVSRSESADSGQNKEKIFIADHSQTHIVTFLRRLKVKTMLELQWTLWNWKDNVELLFK